MQTIYEETKNYLTSIFKERITKKYNFLTLKERETYYDGPYTDQPYDIVANNITSLYDINVHMNEEEDDEHVSITISYFSQRFKDQQTPFRDERLIFYGENDVMEMSEVKPYLNKAINKLLEYLEKDIFIQHLYKSNNPSS